ncbi:MAG TPA: hypothetical protein VIJ11_00495 [Galbitalea sp.]
MTRTRINLITAGLIAGALAVQGFVLALWDVGLGVAGFGLVVSQLISVSVVWSLLVGLLHYAAFGLGVYLALRFFAPIGASDSWRQTIIRAVVAAISGAVVAFAFAALVSLIASVTIGAYPFGYSLNAAVDGNRIQYGIQNAIAAALTPLIGWLPLTVLGCVFLKLWLIAHPAGTPAKDRASVSA